ncbi:outer membrane protein [Sulfitobacter pacificus]|uniref:outer membrane protein n=1 Tax=Sulfitobacter pacificus TaxID=1499314 RepID=UPI0031030661
MKRLLTTATLTVFAGAGGALAGSLAEPVVTPPVLAPEIVSADWTGAYVGIQLGYGNLNVANQIDRDGDGDVDAADETFAFGGGLDGDGAIGGAHIGYMHDFGNFVAGGELDYNAANIDIGTIGELDSVARAKLKLGYDMGQTLVYGVLGAAKADINVGGTDFSENGYVAGFGVDYLVSENVVLGGEVLYHDFGDDFDGLDLSADATTVQVKMSYKF